MHLSVDVDEIKFGDKKYSSAVNEQSIFLSSLLAEKENLPVQVEFIKFSSIFV